MKKVHGRTRRRGYKWLGVPLSVLAISGTVMDASSNAFASSTPHLSQASLSAASSTETGIITCRGNPVVRPRTFIITCADANTQLTETHWTSWTSSGASGITTFAMNRCTPYCAASPMSYFPKSRVTLSNSVATKKGKFFSLMTVHYVLHGQAQSYRFSWKGDPSF